jgi:putative NADH-flavin reductase
LEKASTDTGQAGGNLGPAILSALINESSFNVTVLSRENSTSTFPSGANVIRANYDSPESLKKALEGQDVVISLVASSVLGEQNKFIDAAIAAGVKRFLPSEFGSDTADEKTRAVVPISNAKYDTVNYLKSKESELSWTSVITGPFFDWCLRIGFNGFDFGKKTATIFDNGVGRFSTSNLHTVGLAVVKALENPELTKNQYVYVSGLETTQNEILAAVEKVTGEKWMVTQSTTKELADTGRAKVEKGDYMGILDLLRSVTFGAEEELGRFKQTALWNEKLGLPNDDLEKTIRAVVEGKLAHEL